MDPLTEEQLTKIHDAAMQLLRDVGIAFNEPEALEIFKDAGFKVDGKTVRFAEDQVRRALETAPAEFKVTARNPDKSLVIGGGLPVFLPGYGAPFIALGGRESAGRHHGRLRQFL